MSAHICISLVCQCLTYTTGSPSTNALAHGSLTAFYSLDDTFLTRLRMSGLQSEQALLGSSATIDRGEPKGACTVVYALAHGPGLVDPASSLDDCRG